MKREVYGRLSGSSSSSSSVVGLNSRGTETPLARDAIFTTLSLSILIRLVEWIISECERVVIRTRSSPGAAREKERDDWSKGEEKLF
jgi:hypothetical protein